MVVNTVYRGFKIYKKTVNAKSGKQTWYHVYLTSKLEIASKDLAMLYKQVSDFIDGKQF